MQQETQVYFFLALLVEMWYISNVYFTREYRNEVTIYPIYIYPYLTLYIPCWMTQ